MEWEKNRRKKKRSKARGKLEEDITSKSSDPHYSSKNYITEEKLKY